MLRLVLRTLLYKVPNPRRTRKLDDLVYNAMRLGHALGDPRPKYGPPAPGEDLNPVSPDVERLHEELAR